VIIMPVTVDEEIEMADEPPLPRIRFTSSDVRKMWQMEVFAGQRFELIDGDLIDKSGQSPQHSHALHSCMQALAETVGLKLIRNHTPVKASPADSKWNFPEADLAVLREYKTDFKRRHPKGNELMLAVEVSDTTLEHDAWTKRDLYARAGVPEYWILDLTYPRLLVFSELNTEKGEYASLKGYTAEDSVTFASKTIPVSALLPKS